MINDIKSLLDIDDAQDKQLNTVVKMVKATLLGKLISAGAEVTELPQELEYIVVEISIRRYNRLGSEGFKSELVEGHRIDFYDLNQEFDPYLDIIESYGDTAKFKRGKVVFM